MRQRITGCPPLRNIRFNNEKNAKSAVETYFDSSDSFLHKIRMSTYSPIQRLLILYLRIFFSNLHGPIKRHDKYPSPSVMQLIFWYSIL
jgi:hypothetical protein